ncbi:MAG: hypothetical protein ACT4OE_03260 [Sphingosinicella sp.]
MAETPIVAASAIAIMAMLCVTGLRAWRGWLDTRRLEIAHQAMSGGETDAGTRIELAAVKERVKRLEAIAAGVEL